jgi:hypothetical protein
MQLQRFPVQEKMQAYTGDSMRKTSDFRRWVEMIWRDNCEECLVWRERQQTLHQYFARYKYWLKREFRHQRSLDQ